MRVSILFLIVRAIVQKSSQVSRSLHCLIRGHSCVIVFSSIFYSFSTSKSVSCSKRNDFHETCKFEYNFVFSYLQRILFTPQFFTFLYIHAKIKMKIVIPNGWQTQVLIKEIKMKIELAFVCTVIIYYIIGLSSGNELVLMYLLY